MTDEGPYRRRLPGAGNAENAHCPSCNSPVAGEPRLCAECGTPIAILRCGDCYHMNLPSSAACTGCGQPLGLEPLGEPDGLTCPACKLPFAAFRGDAGVLRDCGRCGGQFVDHALLQALLEQREAYGTKAPRPPRFNPLDTPVRYLPCPICQDVMTRRNFGRSSGVIVDDCGAHGSWFDVGELPRVLAFVEAGGLQLTRQRDEEDRRRRESLDRVRQVERVLAPVSARGSARIGGDRTRQEMSEASEALWRFVSALLK